MHHVVLTKLDHFDCTDVQSTAILHSQTVTQILRTDEERMERAVHGSQEIRPPSREEQ